MGAKALGIGSSSPSDQMDEARKSIQSCGDDGVGISAEDAVLMQETIQMRNSKIPVFSAESLTTNSVGFKIAILGAESTGKSSFCDRFAHNQFYEHSQSTIGAASHRVDHFMRYFGTRFLVNLEIWDVSGCHRYATLVNHYSNSVAAVIVFFDLWERSSFEEAKKLAKRIASKEGSSRPAMILVGNKSDKPIFQKELNDSSNEDDEIGQSEIAHSTRISAMEVKAFSRELGDTIPFFEVSCKNNQNIRHTIDSLVEILVGMPPNTVNPLNQTAFCDIFVTTTPAFSVWTRVPLE